MQKTKYQKSNIKITYQNAKLFFSSFSILICHFSF